ncbi:MAG: dTMP kinase [Gammaproteobacteria bacterium]|nr:dTMP kinase [Gammaproteobacteria bacterium]MDH3429069.1 dTMP kinase [Gammaproteobacteria bacterium]MDH3434429.1 dTMP kinase [Gammaproteobacteria bacterium]
MQTGKFITFEGIEGVGKSTNIAHLTQAIERRGHTVLTTREPGGTPMAERIRELVAEHGDEAMPDIAELLLVFASRALHVNNVIRPALAAGTWVICDRFTDSSRAYQGGGRGLPQEDINLLAKWVHGDLRPDLTILLDAPVETGMSRAGQRGAPDRWELERSEFFMRVRATYLQLAEAEPDRFIIVDATQDLATVQQAIGAIADAL